MIEVFVLRPLRRMSIGSWVFMGSFFLLTLIFNCKTFVNRKKQSRKYTLLQYVKDEYRVILGSVLMWYVAMVFTMTILTRSYNMFLYKRFVPLWSWLAAIKEIVTGVELVVTEQILANIAMMVPLGFLLYFINRTTVWEALIYGCLFSTYMELLQFMFQLGVFEWDDIVHNALGSAFGACMAKVLKKIVTKK